MSFFSKIGNAISKALGFAKSKADVAVNVVDILKQAVDSPWIDFLASLEKSGKAGKYLPEVREILKIASAETLAVKDILVKGKSNEEIISYLISFLRTQTDNQKAEFWTILAGKITQYLADGKLSYQESMDLAKYIYDNKHK